MPVELIGDTTTPHPRTSGSSQAQPSVHQTGFTPASCVMAIEEEGHVSRRSIRRGSLGEQGQEAQVDVLLCGIGAQPSWAQLRYLVVHDDRRAWRIRSTIAPPACRKHPDGAQSSVFPDVLRRSRSRVSTAPHPARRGWSACALVITSQPEPMSYQGITSNENPADSFESSPPDRRTEQFTQPPVGIQDGRMWHLRPSSQEDL